MGVGENDTIIYVIDISGDMGPLMQAFVDDLGFDTQSGRGGGMVGDSSGPPIADGPKGIEPLDVTTLKK